MALARRAGSLEAGQRTWTASGQNPPRSPQPPESPRSPVCVLAACLFDQVVRREFSCGCNVNTRRLVPSVVSLGVL